MSSKIQEPYTTASPYPELDQQLETLYCNREKWANTSVVERIAILSEIRECLMPVAQAWAETAARNERICNINLSVRRSHGPSAFRRARMGHASR